MCIFLLSECDATGASRAGGHSPAGNAGVAGDSPNWGGSVGYLGPPLLRRQRRNAAACCCSVLGCVSPPIGQTLANRPHEGRVSALGIVHLAGVVAEVELGGVSSKVRLAHVVIGADHAALEDRKEVLDRVAVLEPAGRDVLAGAVIDRPVAMELATDAGVNAAFVGHQIRRRQDVRKDQRTKLLGGHLGNMEAANVAVALDQRHDRLLGARGAKRAVLSLSADIGFIGFHDLVRTAERGRVRRGHGGADTVAHEPRGFVRYAERTAHLMRAHALLGRRHKTEREQPLIERNLAVLEDRTDRNREGFGAVVALMDAGTGRLTCQLGDLVHAATMRADRTIGPMQRLKVFAGCVGVGEDRVAKVHGRSPWLTPKVCARPTSTSSI
jgi:hypothetical protein